MCIKLLISDFAIRRRYVSREAYHVMQQLIDHYGWKHIETNELASRPHHLCERIREHCGDLPNVVLFWEGYHIISLAFMQIFKSDFRVVVFCEDLHWFHEQMRATKLLALTSADVVLASYAPVLDRFFPEIAVAKRVVWVPHAASPEFLLPINDRADNVVLLSGKISDYYPLRQRMKSLVDRTDLNIIELRHPGYQCDHDHHTSNAVGPGYARRINQSRAAFTDASRFNYVLAKFFEIPAAGSLLLGDAAVEDQLSELGFRKEVHYIPVSGQTLESRLRHITDTANHDELDKVRRNGQSLVLERHQTSHRAKLINDVCLAP